MISKSLLVESGFDRVQGSSVWHHSVADVYVKYIDLVIRGEVTILDGNTASDEDLIAAVNKGVEESVVETIREEPAKVEEAPVVEEAPKKTTKKAKAVDTKLVD